MGGHTRAVVLVAAATLLAAPAAAQGAVKAGVAEVDASWHVGASAGQYASDGSAVDPANGNYDPTMHSTRRAASYGIQSRLKVRAIVIEGPGGNRMALVKNDLYIPQDLLWRRTAQLLEAKPGLKIGKTNLTIAASHNHSSPYYSSPSWGVWAFQDVFDVRFYNYYAKQMAAAVEQAASKLVPVRVGASVTKFDKTHRHSFGGAIAEDGTPAGYLQSDTDHDLTVIRFDDISDPSRPKPLANVVNWALHPEFLDGNDLISEDYLASTERMTDDRTGALTIWTQSAVGTSEPENSTFHSIHERLEFSHREYAQAEYAGRLHSNAIVDTWKDIAEGTPAEPARFVPFRSNFAAGEVAFEDRWFPGPVSHPYPGVSNCRTNSALAGDPQIPIVGLPTCQGVESGLGELAGLIGLPDPPDVIPGVDPGLTTDDFERVLGQGVVPENYSAPAYTGLEEDIDVHLQAFRIGEILFTACSCEQWSDQSANIETRTDKKADNAHLGIDYKNDSVRLDPGDPSSEVRWCTQNADTTWKCRNPSNPAVFLPDPPLSNDKVEKMHSQVTNPANGWNDITYASQAEAEPADPAQIKGNYTHDDRCKQPILPVLPYKPESDAWDKPCGRGEESPSAKLGYTLTVPLGMTNDYNGYIATYREYQRGDHYRKALTAWGPHASDYMASRLVNMGRVLRDPSLRSKLLPSEFFDAKVPLDQAHNDARAKALGETGGAATAAYEAALPDDGGDAKAVKQPAAVERFDGTFFTWNGGSNFTDNPRVKLQRKVGDGWTDYARQDGELPVTIDYPEGPDTPSYETGSFEWHWTAHFEAFAGRFETVEGNRATPAGTYRFVVDGRRRKGRAVQPYRVESAPFEVQPWDGITVEDLKVDGDGRVSFKVGPRTARPFPGVPGLVSQIGPIDYPDTYDYGSAGPLPRFIEKKWRGKRDPEAPDDGSKIEWLCDECSFRPWLDSGDAETANLRVASTEGSEIVPARREGDRWVSERPLTAGEAAYVGAGCVQDPYGNFNGAASGVVGAGGVAASGSCAAPAGPGAPAGSGGSGGSGDIGVGAPGGGGSQGDSTGRAGCATPGGRLGGRRLGPAGLGLARARNRARLQRAAVPHRRPRRSVDRFCLADGRHLRIGYPSRALLRTLSRSERRRVRGRAIFMTTSSPRYHAIGKRPGSSSRGLRGRRFRVGANLWVLRRARRATVLYKVRRGRVLEVGLGDRRLTRGRAAARRYLRSFR